MFSIPTKEVISCITKDSWQFVRNSMAKRLFDRIAARKIFLGPDFASHFHAIRKVESIPADEVVVMETFHSQKGEKKIRRTYRFPEQHTFAMLALEKPVEILAPSRISLGKHTLLDLGQLADSSFNLHRERFVEPEVVSLETVGLPWTLGACSYGDFVIRVLPLIHQVTEAMKGDKIRDGHLQLPNVTSTRWCQEFLSMFSIPPSKVLPDHARISVQPGGTLYFTNGTSASCNVAHPLHLHAIRNQVLNSVSGINAEAAPRIYISRSNGRVMRNEFELLSGLIERGFKIIRPEDLSIPEQIVLFANAEIIAGPHGAGHANILWSKPGTRLLEVFHPAWKHPCYSILASLVGVSYHSMVSEAIGFSGHWNRQSRCGMSLDVTAPPHEFFRVIDKIIATPTRS